MTVTQLGLMLLVACVVAILCQRLRLPYSVGLVAAGTCLALQGGPMRIALSPDLIYTVLLPPLIFEAALQLKWAPFRRNLAVTLTLAFPGVLLSGALIAAGMHYLAGWTWIGAALLGALISATDPVSVIAAFKDLRVEPRLSLLVESESLLNDGAAAVGFVIVAAVANGATLQFAAMAGSLLWMVLGGVAVGALVAVAALLLVGRTDNHLVEITLTTIAAYGSFLLAQRLHMSGVLAASSAGLVVGNLGMPRALSETGQEYIVAFWEYGAFLANSVVFLLIGGYEAREAGHIFSAGAAVAIGLVLLARIATVYPLCALFARTRLRIDARYQHVLVWGGLRGALALALALAVPDTVAEKGAIIVAAFAVVAFSIFAQGITMPWLVHVLRLAPAPPL